MGIGNKNKIIVAGHIRSRISNSSSHLLKTLKAKGSLIISETRGQWQALSQALFNEPALWQMCLSLLCCRFNIRPFKRTASLQLPIYLPQKVSNFVAYMSSGSGLNHRAAVETLLVSKACTFIGEYSNTLNFCFHITNVSEAEDSNLPTKLSIFQEQ